MQDFLSIAVERSLELHEEEGGSVKNLGGTQM